MDKREFNKLLLSYFDEINEKYSNDLENIWDGEEIGSTILIEDYLMPFIYEHLSDNKIMIKLSDCLEEIIMKNDEFCEEVLYCAFFEKIHYENTLKEFIPYFKTKTNEFYNKLRF